MKKIFLLFTLISLISLISKCAEAQWVQNNGPNSGNIQSIAISGSNIFVGTSDNGIFLTSNNGSNWSPANNGLMSQNVTALAVSGSNTFAGTDNGVYISTNNGTYWTPAGLLYENIYCFLVSGSNIFAGTGSGVYITTNNGTNWTAANNGISGLTINALTSTGNNVFAGTNIGVYLTTNNGANWTLVNNGLGIPVVRTLTTIGTYIIAGTWISGVFISTNNGTNWIDANNGLTNQNVNSLVVSNNKIFAGTGLINSGGVFLSTNLGASWVSAGLSDMTIGPLAASGNNTYACTGFGLFLSANNGVNWNSIGINNQNIYALNNLDNYIFAGTFGYGIYFTTNYGNNWYVANNGLTNSYIRCISVLNNNIFAGTNQGVFLSTDNGTTWNAANSGISNQYVTCIANSGNNIFAGTSNSGVFVSNNNGLGWNAVNNGLINHNIYSFVVANSSVIAGTGAGVFLTTNNGTLWNSIGLVNQQIYSLVLTGNNIFAGTFGGGIFISTNYGGTWASANNGLTNLNIWSLAFSGSNVIAGTDSGVFVSTNMGTNWVSKNQGFSDIFSIRSLMLTNNYIFAGTVNSSVWKRPIPETILNQYSVTGTVKYADNNQPVTSGVVKAIKLDKSNGNIIVLDSAFIQSNGTYSLYHVPQDSLDIGIYPNSTPPNDWVISYYSSTIYWQNATHLYPIGNLTNINILALRMSGTTANNSVNGKVMRLTDAIVGNLKDAILYARSGNTFVRCAVSDVEGVYHLQSLPTGNLKIICNRLGFTGDSTNVNVTSTSNIDSINFYLYWMYVGIRKISEAVPSDYKLYQNYPNPFNPVTNIKYQITKNSFVTLKVFDILGREIEILINEKQSAGTYEVTFDASQFPSGVYFYRLTVGDSQGRTGSFTNTKKMLLIK